MEDLVSSHGLIREGVYAITYLSAQLYLFLLVGEYHYCCPCVSQMGPTETFCLHWPVLIKPLLHGRVGPKDRRLFTGPGGASDTFVHNSIISPQCPVEVALPFWQNKLKPDFALELQVPIMENTLKWYDSGSCLG